MYVKNNEVLLEALTRNRRTRRPPGFDAVAAMRKLQREMKERLDDLESSLAEPLYPVSLFSVAQVADMFGVSVRTIESLIADGELVPIYIRSVRRISKESIEAYIRASTGFRRN